MTKNRLVLPAITGCLLISVLLGGTAGPVAASDPTVGSGGAELAVTGFQGEWSPQSKITRSAEALTTVGVAAVAITLDGTDVAVPSADARKQLKTTHRLDLRGEILISNYIDSVGDFSEEAAYRLLSSRSNIDTVVAKIVDSVEDQGWDGVSIDLEALIDRDRAGLTRFAKALDQALPAGKTLSINVGLRQSQADYRHSGFDLGALASLVDRVILMAYDQHGPWDDTPGPIGELSWQTSGLEAMLEAVPADQVDLGVAGYGYGWRPDSIVTLSDARARSLVRKDGATAQWDEEVGEWTATLSDGSILWWSDARSYAARYALAAGYHLNGVAVWSLGLSDPIEPQLLRVG